MNAFAQFYTGSQLDFGKNRIQYNEPRYWTYYSYDRYSVYYYEGGKEIANYVSKSAKKNIEQIEKMLDSPVDKKIQFIVYNKQSDFEQSNIGYSTDEQYNIGGVTKIVGTKVILYFEGDHQKLEQQIRAGIAEVIINQMMYGGEVRDMVKNSTLLVLPEWYIKGLISYISIGWNTDVDNRLRDGIKLKKYNKFNRLSGSDATYAGHSIWNYIAEVYGEAVIPNLLYMTKVSRGVENSFLFVLGSSMKTMTAEWIYFYQNRYSDFESDTQEPTSPILKKPRASRIYSQLKVSPDGKNVIYVTNEMGQYKVWLYNFEKNKAKRILKSGQKIERINDVSYPLLSWHPSGLYFSVIRERKSKLFLMQYELEDKERSERLIINFEKILDFSYSDDGKKFVMSAIQNGQSDIFVFTAASNGYEQITKDIYDDLTPRFVHNSESIVFSSNRDNDTVKAGNKDNEQFDPLRAKDIFLYDYRSRSNLLKRITNTPSISETNPDDYDSLHISYLSDKNGIKNRYIAHLDSTISYIDTSTHYRLLVTNFPATNYPYNIIEQTISVKANKSAEIFYSNGKYRMYVTDLEKSSALKNRLSLTNTKFRNDLLKTEEQKILASQPSLQKKDSVLTTPPPLKPEEAQPENGQKEEEKIDINNYVFDNEEPRVPENKNSYTEVKPAESDTSAELPKIPFKLAPQTNYHVNYAVDNVTAQFNNSFLGGAYQKFTGGSSPAYTNPGSNFVLGANMSDLFEDYRIVAICKPEFTGNMEYLLSYEDRLKRLDKQYIVHRQSYPGTTAGNTNIFVHDGRYILKWPFNEVTSVRGSLMLRNDKTVYLSVNDASLQKPNTYENWGGAKLEFIFDNTRNKGLNLYNGLRAKFFAEYNQQIDKTKTDITILGFDARHYQKVHRDIIWANRIAGSTSFGNKKLVYYMGGVDNWFAPKFDNSINVSTEQNYAYQTIATNMRGFYQNIRNGNSFVVVNSELRVPIFKYLMNRPIKSDIINNFQIIGFGDIGTAWTGKSPYSEQNFLKKTVISKPGNPIIVILNNNKEPIVGGFGWGVRTRLWGYFVRIDFAYAVEDGEILPPDRDPSATGKATLRYISLNLDF